MAAKFRTEVVAAGFTDNGGGIHAAERILDILGQRLNYPNLSHLNNLKDYADAEFSPAALKAHQRGERVFIEHVSPRRDFTRKAIDMLVVDKVTDRKFLNFVKKNYRLVLLTPEETKHLNKSNRSTMTPDRLERADIKIVSARKRQRSSLGRIRRRTKRLSERKFVNQKRGTQSSVDKPNTDWTGIPHTDAKAGVTKVERVSNVTVIWISKASIRNAQLDDRAFALVDAASIPQMHRCWLRRSMARPTEAMASPASSREPIFAMVRPRVCRRTSPAIIIVSWVASGPSWM